MGVIYKLKDEVVQYIISQRQGNPLYSCRQLAESASQKFGLNLSKSSVHEVLKESGIITPRGRKPKDKFKIPQEKKKQIQVSLSQTKLIAALEKPEEVQEKPISAFIPAIPDVKLIPDVVKAIDPPKKKEDASPEIIFLPQKNGYEVSAEYEKAGRIFYKAVLWDLGIYSEENIKETDWNYYLTYTKGIKVVLENDKNFFIELLLPIERCVREAADGLINNIKPLIVSKVSDEWLFKAGMDAMAGFKINSISIVEKNDHILLEFYNIMEFKRYFVFRNRVFVENFNKDILKRLKSVFLPQIVENEDVIDNIMNFRGFDSTNDDENIVTLIIDDTYDNKNAIQKAAEALNGMFLRDEQNRLVTVKVQDRSM